MSKMMLIDAIHAEETRVALVANKRVEDFDFETRNLHQLRGNIYLAKVTRVEPSLQAAFVDYGGNRHGFLSFDELHPDYYQLPQEDRDILLAEAGQDEDLEPAEDEEEAETQPVRRNSGLHRKYKIQEILKRRQILLVQVVRGERGNKGAAVTTYLSLAGRYCVLMPNTPRGGGISRKISNAGDRDRLKKVMADLSVPEGMGLIIRTAGAKRTKTELKRDFEYLLKLWNKLRELTLSSVAPCIIHEEGGLVHRAIRDLYSKDIDKVWVAGEDAYREAKDLVKMLMPSHAKKVQQHKSAYPIYVEHDIEAQLDSIFDPVVQLKSGGYLVINQTEALVAIDVNSGKATQKHNIEETAVQTNLEAAIEACRQMRLRDLAGLIVIDFIDMEDIKNIRQVERKMNNCMKLDRAKLQNSKLSIFGLMELSRQRRRAGVLDSSSAPCEACNGTGRKRSVESAALQLMRAIEARATIGQVNQIRAETQSDVALYLLNNKREALAAVENRLDGKVSIITSPDKLPGEFVIDAAFVAPDSEHENLQAGTDNQNIKSEGNNKSQQSATRRNRRRSLPDTSDSNDKMDAITPDAPVKDDESRSEDVQTDIEGETRNKRRRGRRGGRRRRGSTNLEGQNTESAENYKTLQSHGEDTSKDMEAGSAGDYQSDISEEKPKRIRRSRPRKTDKHHVNSDIPQGEVIAGSKENTTKSAPKRRRNRKKAADTAISVSQAGSSEAIDTSDSHLEDKPKGRHPKKPPEIDKTEASLEVKPKAVSDSKVASKAGSNAEPTRKGWWQKRLGL